MVEKEILHLLDEEHKFELKLKKAQARAATMQENALIEAKNQAEQMQNSASKEIEIIKKNFQQNTSVTCKKMQEKAGYKIKIIEDCQPDLKKLAKNPGYHSDLIHSYQYL